MNSLAEASQNFIDPSACLHKEQESERERERERGRERERESEREREKIMVHFRVRLLSNQRNSGELQSISSAAE